MRKVILSLLLLLLVGGIGLMVFLWMNNPKLPYLDEVENFTLEEVHGSTYQLENGKVKLISFFYTNCPDICPLTMMDFKLLQERLKQEGIFGKEVELIAISIDPKHDQPQVIRDYASSFSADKEGWKWLRGSNDVTKEIAINLQMQYEKLEGDFYSHSTSMYLLDKDNNVRALYDMAYSKKPIEKDVIIEDILYLTN
ncbi:SCO family protein [Bacillus suaedaesalsae]|uniref:SCO family protein n=1 Tax=Bacillus suaedaesalsae TaxID=2810349 RepID=A0ABS2DI71_9BACI|nr:SCO family protein [Bacillus suaedaesalsae]MBM6618197.1 SCO family protein [Bacillus suaedaesalsae]